MPSDKNFKNHFFETHFGLLIEQISILMQKKILQHLKTAGYEISFNELLMLILLDASPEGLSQQEIADKLFKNKSMVTRFVAHLEKKHFIQRQKDQTDEFISTLGTDKKLTTKTRSS